jgi:hypothetical protein
MSVIVHLFYGDTTYHLLAKETTTLKELLSETPIPEDTVLFTGTPSQSHKTPLVDLSKTLVDYNMWFLDKNYKAEITVYNKTDNYDKKLYEMYSQCTKELE